MIKAIKKYLAHKAIRKKLKAHMAWKRTKIINLP